jgi:bifunctional non-homologous end joining protein LigD
MIDPQLKPALLKTVTADWLERLLDDPGWCLQQKYDGVRCIVTCRGGKVIARSRQGRALDLGAAGPQFPTDQGDYVLDGELAWGHFYPFDELSQPARPYIERLGWATELVCRWDRPRIRRVRTWREPADKREALARARAQQVEGVVLKRLDAAHWSGVDQTRGVRFKFSHRCEVVGSKVGVDGKRNIAMGLYGADREIIYAGILPLGRATDWAAVNEAVAELDHEPVLEVEYLYATPAGLLFQPRLIRVRYDKRPTLEDCPLSQLVGTYLGEMDGGPSIKTFDDPKPVAANSRRRAAKPKPGPAEGGPVAVPRSGRSVSRRKVKVAGDSWWADLLWVFKFAGILMGAAVVLTAVACRVVNWLPTSRDTRMLNRVKRGGGSNYREPTGPGSDD